MKIKIVSDAWGRRKVRRRETLILLVPLPSTQRGRQSLADGKETGFSDDLALHTDS